MSTIKRLPAGVSEYKRIIEGNYYFVDKTMFLPRLEAASDFLFLVRPRRFGKSLFLSMLARYYDIEEKDNFEKLFSGTWIAEHPTAEKNKYLVLRFDFSQVLGAASEIPSSFETYANPVLDTFALKYQRYFSDGFTQRILRQSAFGSKFQYIVSEAKLKDLPLFLIVDEYDNFTNNVLNNEGEEIYHQLTHGEGFYRGLFKKFKPNFTKILMLGVSPVTLDDLTSGYNIATNITADPRFNTMLGFSEEDVRQMIEYYRQAGWITADTESLIEEMKPWYDNYCFAERCLDRDPKMFNADMTLYYLSNIIGQGEAPKDMVDPRTKTDYKKMKKIIQIDKLDNSRRSLIHEIAEKGYVYGMLVDQFPAEQIFRRENFLSLLYYYGMLTITGRYGAALRLAIPNNNVRKQYYHYLLEEYDAIHAFDNLRFVEPFADAAIKGTWLPMMKLMAEAYTENSSVRSLIEGERNIQGFFQAYLSINPYYLTAPEMELQHGYADFFLMPNVSQYPEVQHGYILELKYLKQGESDAVAQKQWQEAEVQIRHYATDARLPHYLHGRNLHLLILQFRGNELLRMEEVEKA